MEENKINKMTQTTGWPICSLSAMCSDFRYHLHDGIPDVAHLEVNIPCTHVYTYASYMSLHSREQVH